MRMVGTLALLGACGFTITGAGGDGGTDTPVGPPDGPVDVSDSVGRVTSGLVSLYRFDENGGATINDAKGGTSPVTVTIADPTQVTWSPGALALTGSATTIASAPSVPNRINTQAVASDEISVEAWVNPAAANQLGQSGQFARVATMSINAGNRNFAIAQPAAIPSGSAPATPPM